MNTREFQDWLAAGRRDFSGENLQKIDLTWQDLSHISFEGADLTHANLSHAILTQVNFKRAVLAFANLHKANLSGANIQGANLEGAKLSEATWIGFIHDQNTHFPEGIRADTLDIKSKPPPLNLTSHPEIKKQKAKQKLDEAQRMHAEAQALRQKAEKIKKQAEADLKASQKQSNKIQRIKETITKVRKQLPEALPSLQALPNDLVKQAQDINLDAEGLVNQIQGIADQASSSLKSKAQQFLQPPPSSPLSSESNESDVFIAEIIDDDTPKEPPLLITEAATPPPFSWKRLSSITSTIPSRLAISSDSQYLAVGQTDSNLSLWKMAHGQIVPYFTFFGQQKGIYGVALSPNNELIASGAGDGNVTIWRLDNKSLYKTLCPSTYQAQEASQNQKLFQAYNPSIFIDSYRAAVSAIAFSPSGNHIIVGYANGTLRLWAIKHGNLLNEVKCHDAPITQIKYSSNGKLLITSSIDQTIKVLLSNSWKVCHSQAYECSWPSDCVITPDHQLLIAGLNNGHIHAWNLSKNREQYRISESHQPGLINLHLSQGQQLLSISQDHQLKIWNWQTGTLISSQSGSYPSCISPQQNLLAISDPKNQIHLLQKIP